MQKCVKEKKSEKKLELVFCFIVLQQVELPVSFIKLLSLHLSHIEFINLNL